LLITDININDIYGSSCCLNYAHDCSVASAGRTLDEQCRQSLPGRILAECCQMDVPFADIGCNVSFRSRRLTPIHPQEPSQFRANEWQLPEVYQPSVILS
jgi:hypothetical protein